ncbi:MAG: hypothetical protein ACI81I_000822, partial [Arcobacteraceae bacterium]
KALYHAEKHIDEKRANTTDISGVLDSLQTSHENPSVDYNIMKTIFDDLIENVTKSDIPKNLQEEN